MSFFTDRDITYCDSVSSNANLITTGLNVLIEELFKNVITV